MNEREELEALRRMAELEAKSGGNSDAPPEVPPMQSQGWRDVLSKAFRNIPSSTANIFSGTYHALTNPAQTGQTLLDIGAGGLQNMLPESVTSFVNQFDPNPQAAERARNLAGAVGRQYATDYGTTEGFKGKLANDPAGVLADAASIMTMGGGAVSKVHGLGQAGRMAINAGKAIDPLALTAKGVARVVPAVGSGVANLVGGIGTHTGGETLKQATRAGMEGGRRGEGFLANMRGTANAQDILADAKQALNNIRTERSTAYRQGMAQVGTDKTVLDMTPIERAYQSARNVGTYKGKVLNRSADGVNEKIGELIDEWKASPPADFHTPEGMDALKRAIGDVRDSTQYGTPERVAADRVYNAVKAQINAQAPHYAFVMKDYETASNLVKEIERSLTGKEGSSADSAIRKLQSLSRNNANTGYGNRLKLANELETAGAPYLLSDIAGQALSSWQPRGLGTIPAAGTVIGGLMSGNMSAIPLLMAQSPRIAGEAAYYTGKASGMLNRGGRGVNALLDQIGVDPTIAANYLYQLQDQ